MVGVTFQLNFAGMQDFAKERRKTMFQREVDEKSQKAPRCMMCSGIRI